MKVCLSLKGDRLVVLWCNEMDSLRLGERNWVKLMLSYVELNQLRRLVSGFVVWIEGNKFRV